MICKICNNNEATWPSGGDDKRYCSVCWNTRLKQLYREEDKFRSHRVIRTPEAEKLYVYHAEVTADEGCCAVVYALRDASRNHLEVAAFLLETVNWEEQVPFIYKVGVESEMKMMDIFLGFLEGDIVASWHPATWTAEITCCKGTSFWIDGNVPGLPSPEEEEET